MGPTGIVRLTVTHFCPCNERIPKRYDRVKQFPPKFRQQHTTRPPVRVGFCAASTFSRRSYTCHFRRKQGFSAFVVDVYFRERSVTRLKSWVGADVPRPPHKRDEPPVQTPRQTPPTRQFLAIGLLIAGIVVTLLAIFADTLEIGTGKGFGYYQMIVLIAGIILLLGGSAMLLQRRTGKHPGDDLLS